MTGIGEALKVVGSIADDLHTSKEEIAHIKLKDKELDTEVMLGQMAINREESKHKSIFVAGWRPFIGWVCGGGVAYNYILYPILKYMAVIFNWAEVSELPVLDLGEMMPIILGMLGIGAMRSYDKQKGNSTEAIDAVKGLSRREMRHIRKMKKIEAKSL